MHRINQREHEWLRNLWKPRPRLKTRDNPAFDHSPFLFKEDEEKFKDILRVRGQERADLIALFYPLKLNYPHLVFDHQYTKKDHEDYFLNQFGLAFLAEDYDPEEPRDVKGRWSKTSYLEVHPAHPSKKEIVQKEEALKAHLEEVPHENFEANLANLEDHIQHFIEENFQSDTTDSVDLRQALAETALESFRGSKNPLKMAVSFPISLLANAAPYLIKHVLKKGLRFTRKSSLRFPLKEGIEPWMERQGEITGKRQKYGVVRLMPPSEDPYQSALNFVRAIRKYKAKQGITSTQIVRDSKGNKDMLLVKFSDKSTISIRQAGDSGILTPDDQVTVAIKGHPELAKLSNASKKTTEFKFKFPKTSH